MKKTKKGNKEKKPRKKRDSSSFEKEVVVIKMEKEEDDNSLKMGVNDVARVHKIKEEDFPLEEIKEEDFLLCKKIKFEMSKIENELEDYWMDKLIEKGCFAKWYPTATAPSVFSMVILVPFATMQTARKIFLPVSS